MGEEDKGMWGVGGGTEGERGMLAVGKRRWGNMGVRGGWMEFKGVGMRVGGKVAKNLKGGCGGVEEGWEVGGSREGAGGDGVEGRLRRRCLNDAELGGVEAEEERSGGGKNRGGWVVGTVRCVVELDGCGGKREG